MSAEMGGGRRLGRGLKALIPGEDPREPTGGELSRIPISRIRPNPYQPRRTFDPEELGELEASLKASGLLQPITVRRAGDAYELIAGERRLRAATNLGWTEIQGVVKDLDDQALLVLALVENLQRSDLNPIEEAHGYQRLIEEFGHTHQQIADAVGKDRTTVTNLLRLLQLPTEVQSLVERRQISGGHARALLPLGTTKAAVALATEAADQGLSVRQLEQRVRSAVAPTPAAEPVRAAAAVARPADPSARAMEDDLRRYLQTDVHLKLTGAERGSINIAFYSADDLDRVLQLVLRDGRDAF